jgi:hypothetical protein
MNVRKKKKNTERQSIQKVIPCLHKNVSDNDIKWGSNKIQGVKFNDEYELARDLYSKVLQRVVIKV